MLRQFLKFILIGSSSSLVNFLVYNGMLCCAGELHLFAKIDYLIAQIIGFVVSVFWSFYLSRKFVFTSQEEKAVPWHQALVKMYLSYGFTGFCLNSILSIIWVRFSSLMEKFLLKSIEN